jgi:hypothetical protein
MTQWHHSSGYISLADTSSRSRGLIHPSFAGHSTLSNPRGRREDRVPTGTRGPLREMHTQEEPHSSIQVVPITRPSLRDGRTAYAVISREPNFPSGLPRRSNWDDAVHPVGLARIFERLDRSNDGQDHTVLPYARSALSPQYSRPRRRSRKLTGETNLAAPSSARGHGLTGTTRPARTSHADAAASTASPARDQDDIEIAPLGEPGWATHTSKPKFGKVEYFCGKGLTGWRVFCPTGRSCGRAGARRHSEATAVNPLVALIPPRTPPLPPSPTTR